MAEKKAVKNSSAAKKNTKAKSTAKRKSANAPNGLMYIIAITVCILLVIFTYTMSAGVLGGAIRGVLFGLFGKVAYVLPIAAFSVVMYLFYAKDTKKFAAKSILTTFLLWIMSSIIHLKSDPVLDISEAYSMGDTLGGGFLGACIACPLFDVIGSAGTLIVLIALAVIIISLITKISFISMIGSFFSGIAEEFKTVEEVDNREAGRTITKKVKETTRRVRETRDDVNEAIEYLKSERKRVIDFKMKENEEKAEKKALEEELKRAEDIQSDIIKQNIDEVIQKDEPDKERPSIKEQMDKIYGKKEDKKEEISETEEIEEKIEDAVKEDSVQEVEDYIIEESSEVIVKNPESKTILFNKVIKEDNHKEVKLESPFSLIDPETGEIISVSDDKEIRYQENIEDYSEYYTSEDYEEAKADIEIDNSTADMDDIVFKSMDDVAKETKKSDVAKSEEPKEFLRQKETAVKAEAKTYVEKEEPEIDIQKMLDAPIEHKPYVYPSTELLNMPKTPNSNIREEMRATALKLVETLKNFNVNVKLTEVTQGPSVTRYEIQPEVGVKLSKIVGLSDDLAMNLAVSDILIAPVPGKPAIGIEVPNKEKNMVSVRELIDSEEFRNVKSKLAFVVGKDIGGRIITADIAKMPHLLIAGSTGSGKSVFINTLITSILYNASPEEVKLIMVDPKVVELGVYNGIPHLMIPVVTEPKQAAGALNWAVQEMMKRYDLFAKNKVRNLAGYNKIAEENELEKLPQILIIIDELADLMMVAAKEVEGYICRLAQLARAAGIHLVIATQRPSVDVITGLIKANIPSRAALFVSSQVDSRTILGKGGAEKLLGNGDMLFHPAGEPNPKRVQGAYVSDDEIEKVVKFLIENSEENSYAEDLAEHIERCALGENGVTPDEEDDGDELLPRAIQIAIEAGQISTSMVQRRLGVGYARAGRIIDQMEARGVIGGANGSKPREVLLPAAEYYG